MNAEIPIVLYKYKDVTGNGIAQVEDMLRNNRVWFSSPKQFNDPFDCRRPYDINSSREQIVSRRTGVLARKGAPLSEALAQAQQEIPQGPGEPEAWHRKKIQANSDRIENTGILCLTPYYDNILMWTHYAGWHSGICIRFRVRDEQEKLQIDFIGEAQRIEYSDRCPLVNFIEDGAVEIVRKILLTKAAPYSYESERRIVRLNDGPGLKSIPKGIIGGVILGVNIDPTIRDRVVQACDRYDGDVDIVRASLDTETYGLRFELESTV